MQSTVHLQGIQIKSSHRRITHELSTKLDCWLHHNTYVYIEYLPTYVMPINISFTKVDETRAFLLYMMADGRCISISLFYTR